MADAMLASLAIELVPEAVSRILSGPIWTNMSSHIIDVIRSKQRKPNIT